MSESENKMQICNCLVALSGNIRNVTYKHEVTPAEVIVLRAIHGEHSVTEIVPKGHVDRSSAGEKLRLCQHYNRENKFDVDKLYPGVGAQIPNTFKDAGIDIQLAGLHTDKGTNVDTLTSAEKEKISTEKSTATATKPRS
jgi:hypothetical protein